MPFNHLYLHDLKRVLLLSSHTLFLASVLNYFDYVTFLFPVFSDKLSNVVVLEFGILSQEAEESFDMCSRKQRVDIACGSNLKDDSHALTTFMKEKWLT